MRWQDLLAENGRGERVRALVLSLPLLALVLCGPWWQQPPLGSILGWYPLPIAFAVLVQFGWGRAGFLRALSGILAYRIGADFLIHIAAAAALALALWTACVMLTEPAAAFPVVGHDPQMLLAVWRDCAFGASLVALHLIGEMAVRANGTAPLLPRVAEVTHGQETDLAPGALVVVDGRVTDGTSEVQDPRSDQGVFPVVVGPGSVVHAGARNGDGTLRLLPCASPDAAGGWPATDGSASHVAQNSDRVARIMMCCAAGAIGWQLWRAAPGLNVPALVLLMVAQAAPLSLALAASAPVAELLRLCHRLGIHIGDFSALEKLQHINGVAFGDHGVLIPDRMRVTSLQAAQGIEARDLVNSAASLAKSGYDPWGTAVLEFAVAFRMRLQLAEAYRCVAGGGVAATVGGQPAAMGTRAFIETQGIDCSSLDEAAANAEGQGRRLRWVAELAPSPRLLGFVVFGSAPVTGAAVALKNLGRVGLATAWLARGDDVAARVLAKSMKVDELLGGRDAASVGAFDRWRARWGPLMVVASYLRPGMAGDDDVTVRFGARALATRQAAAFVISRQDPGLVVDLIGIVARYRRMVRLNNLVVIATTLAVMVLPPVFVFDLAYASYEIVVSVLLLVSALGLRAQPLTANDVDEE